MDVIGSPFFDCQKCGSTNLHNEITEWDLHPWQRKLPFFVLGSLFTFLGGLGLALTGLKLLEFSSWIDKVTSAKYYLPAACLGILLMAAAVIYRLGKQIRASRERMRNPVYTAKLRALGLRQNKYMFSKASPCKQCKYPFEYSSSYFEKIGKPYFKCEHCSSINRHPEMTEWKLFPLARQFIFLLRSILLIALGGLFSSFFLAKLLKFAGLPEQEVLLSMRIFLILIIAAALVHSLIKPILTSGQRTSNPAYLDKLRSLGLL